VGIVTGVNGTFPTCDRNFAPDCKIYSPQVIIFSVSTGRTKLVTFRPFQHTEFFNWLNFSGNTNWHRTGSQLTNYSALMQQSHATSTSLQQSNIALSASQMLDQVTLPSTTATTTLLSTPSFASTTQGNSNVMSHGTGYSAPPSCGSGDYQHCDTTAAAGVWGTRLNNDTNWSHHSFPAIADNYG
jgi:hypothetical protein